MKRFTAIASVFVSSLFATSVGRAAEDEVPAVIAAAPETVQLMTWPIKEDPSNCFPQRYVAVRKNGELVMLQDVSLYKGRKPWVGEGLVEIRVGGKVGYINADGRIVIAPQFQTGRPFSNGFAVVELNGKFGYIKMDGTWLFGPTLDWGYDFLDGYASASEGGKFGILDAKGRWRLRPEFKRLDPGFYAVRANGEEGYFDPKTLKFITEGKVGKYYTKPTAAE